LTLNGVENASGDKWIYVQELANPIDDVFGIIDIKVKARNIVEGDGIILTDIYIGSPVFTVDKSN
jgi:hypothetical protein